MSDCKSELLQSISNTLIKVVDAETASMIQDILLIKMKDYDIERRTTALTTEVRQTDERIIASFLACITIEGKSKGTLLQYKRSIQKLLDYTGKSCLTVTSNDIRAWLADMKISGLKNSSISNQRHNVASFFKWLRSEDIRADNPCEAINSIKVPKEERKAFTSEDVDTMRSASNTFERAVIETLLSSGVRVAELCNLELDDIDFDGLTVKVRSGKGGKDRTTFITRVCKKHLLKYISEKKTPSVYVFSKSDGSPYTTGGIRRMLHKMGQETDIHIHPHRFRRTLATDLAKKGMPIQEIKVILGHSDIATTQRYIDTELSQVHASYKQFVA